MSSVRPVSATEPASFVVPEPGAGLHVAFLLFPYPTLFRSLHSVTSKPLGLTTPLSVAVVEASELAGSVLTVGLTGVVVVLKVASAPSEVQPERVGMICK